MSAAPFTQLERMPGRVWLKRRGDPLQTGQVVMFGQDAVTLGHPPEVETVNGKRFRAWAIRSSDDEGWYALTEMMETEQ